MYFSCVKDITLIDKQHIKENYTQLIKTEIQTTLKRQFDNWMFGYDIYQDVCP